MFWVYLMSMKINDICKLNPSNNFTFNYYIITLLNWTVLNLLFKTMSTFKCVSNDKTYKNDNVDELFKTHSYPSSVREKLVPR